MPANNFFEVPQWQNIGEKLKKPECSSCSLNCTKKAGDICAERKGIAAGGGEVELEIEDYDGGCAHERGQNRLVGSWSFTGSKC